MDDPLGTEYGLEPPNVSWGKKQALPQVPPRQAVVEPWCQVVGHVSLRGYLMATRFAKGGIGVGDGSGHRVIEPRVQAARAPGAVGEVFNVGTGVALAPIEAPGAALGLGRHRVGGSTNDCGWVTGRLKTRVCFG